MRWIYAVLKDNHYNIGSFEVFLSTLSMKEDRKWCFEKLNICLNHIVSKEQFEKLIDITE